MPTIALVAACVSVVLSITLPILMSDRTLRSAFNTLEDDFETLRATVRSDLGRVARLKRSIMRGEVPVQEEPAAAQPDTIANGAVTGSSLSPTQRAMQAKILARRHKAVQ